MHDAPNNRTTTPHTNRTEAMATAIVTLAREYGVVTIPDLIARGFSQDEIDRLGDRARAMASAEIDQGWEYR